MLHQEAHDRWPPLQDGVMKRLVLVALSDVHVHEFGTSVDHGLDRCEIVGVHGIDKLLDRHGGHRRSSVTDVLIGELDERQDRDPAPARAEP